MAYTVIMPRQGQSVESCVLGAWHKKRGESVSAGDLLFTYETDKSAFEEYSKESGTMLEIFFGEGDDVPCLESVCVIGEPGEYTGAEVTINDANNKIKISPRAENLAARAGADVTLAAPTGPNGRIVAADIEALLNNQERADVNKKEETINIQKPADSGAAHLKEPSESSGFEYVKHSGVRRAIAKTMHASLSEMAQLTIHSSYDASDVLSLRAKLKKLDINITVGDIILFAVSRVLPNHRVFNAHCDEGGLKIFSSVNLGVAVDAERGLLVPTLFNADKMSLRKISEEVKERAAACRDGKIKPDALKDGTFTVTNLGALGVESFTPVINPPQTAILGVCSVTERPVTIDGQIKTYPAMGLSLTFDHRAADGAAAARFLTDLKKFLENFTAYAII